ncbi:NADH-quinone oxidoreductase subunit J [Caldovatus aquaticus]|uniref:NADH-quinone oxidoreductase subunit J n=1 Tax=Caldovatus aquaticus TaxID=2865671 RepID=A0ABS7F0J7_9PROT|nr:NADH-quinone oxidoreductase subunit J [Caldovatus aquaticus]MBW8268492.1 NADH-quinone oxidoreductase subunit J [Caldovatus aquaticus]
MLAAVAFYAFSAVLIASAAMVVVARNPVHSVLFLILAFFNAAGLMLIAGGEFLAMILVIVYVGAVAVLFLFVVMMLDVDFARMREGFQRYAPVGALVGGVLLVELLFVLGSWRFAPEAPGLRLSPNPGATVGNTEALARILYTDNVLLFQAAGVILLVAMIGAIVLTLRERPGTRRQVIAAQVARAPAETVVLRQVPIGAGLKNIGILRPPPAAEEREALSEPERHGHGGGHH